MRMITLAALAVVPVLTLSACASGGTKTASTSDMAKLEQDCKARGGFIKPRMGRQSAYPALDNYCDVTNSPDPSGTRDRQR